MINCALCHGQDRKSQDVFPSFIDVGERVSIEKLDDMIHNGKGSMPAFPQLGSEERGMIIAYLLGMDLKIDINETKTEKIIRPQEKVKYTSTGYAQFRDEQGYPAVKPPWGTLSAIDMNNGEILWQKPLGEFPELTAKGIPPTDTQNLSGSLLTASGLVFIGASADGKFRAFDKTTCEILWDFKLPFGGYATPATYKVKDVQYVVIAAVGEGKIGTKSGDVYI